MENTEGFSGEMMQMYSSLLMQSNKMALNNMLATISAMQTQIPINPDIFVGEAVQQLTNIIPAKSCKSLTERSTSSSTPQVRSDDKIPIEEIQCDIGTFVAKNFKRYLKLNKWSLDEGDPEDFRLLIAKLCADPLYQNAPREDVSSGSLGKQHLQAGTKRKSTGSPLTQAALSTSLDEDKRNYEEEEQANCKRLKMELNDSQNNNNVSQIDEMNYTAGKSDVTISHLDCRGCEIDTTAGVLDFSATMSETAENLDKTMDNLNATAEQIVARSPAEAPQRSFFRPKTSRAPFSSAEVEMRFNRLKEIQRRKPKFDVDVSKLPYNSNMKRSFPANFRSAHAQLKRDKNTIAARVSRIRNKYYEQMLQQRGTEMLAENIRWKRKIACYRLYANKLIEMLGLEPVDFGTMWDGFIKEKLEKDAKGKLVKEGRDKKLD